MEDESGTRKLSLSYRVKESVVSTSLLALATAFEIVSKHSAELKAELAGWEEGRTFSLGVLPEGPAITLKKEGDRIIYLGKGEKNPGLKILFKNLDSALLPFTGQMGSHTAFIQHRAILHGNIGEAMQISRAMNMVQKYLMPGFILNKTFKSPPKLGLSGLLLKAWVMATLAIGLIANAFK
jgi:hypothetical protein